MPVGKTMTFRLPESWSLRKVATAMAKEWLPPLRSEPAVKAARWVVQSIVADPGKATSPLWEAGISTAEYEQRLERPDLGWAIRASAGRGKSMMLAHLEPVREQAGTFALTVAKGATPEMLFDPAKVAEYLGGDESAELEDLFTSLLTRNGVELLKTETETMA